MKKPISKKQSLYILFLPLLLFNVVHCAGETETSTLAPMEKTEKEALYSAIQGFLGKWWNGSNLYPDPCGWTPIQGVDCDFFDGLWYVTTLSMGPIHENYPTCTGNPEFRWQLFELKNLKKLSIISCFRSLEKYSQMNIPTRDWQKLAGTLESLEFRSNPGLIGKIPLSFGSLTKLQSLVLLENGLTGEIPTSLGNLISLKRLILAGNRFTGEIPISLGGLNELLILDSSRNLLTGSLPITFGGLTSLLKLDLSNNFLSGKLPNEIENLKNLTILDLRNNKFSGGLTKSLQEMVPLQDMALSNNPIGGNIMDLKWENLQNLVNLDLSKMGLSGEVPESIIKLKRLRYLGLNDNNLSGNLSPKLATLPSLTALYLSGNNLTGELNFSEWFYEKMGRRFSASSNPNLCYPVKLISIGFVPFGVKSCQEEVSLFNNNSKTNLDSHENSSKDSSSYLSSSSMGCSICGVSDWFWRDMRVKEVVVLLLVSNFVL